MRVQKIEPGLWRWTGRHPEWTDDQDWDPEVGSVYHETAEAVLLIDPVVPPEDTERFWAALDTDVKRLSRPVHVLLTVHWHGRSCEAMRERYGAEVWADERVLADTPRETQPTRTFRPGDPLPGGVLAHDAVCFLETVYWLPGPGAIVFGDIVSGADGELRLCPEDWLGGDAGHDELRQALRPLLEHPVRHVLVSHGEPVLGNGQEELARLLG
jgi:glyoxylase-like metal-dependent hydrolase (beta-lactamase superfamily II)